LTSSIPEAEYNKDKSSIKQKQLVCWLTAICISRGDVIGCKTLGILTCQLIDSETEYLQLHQLDDFQGNWPYTKSKQNNERKDRVNWFTTRVIDGKISLQYYGEDE
jgi:hypothetical protein